MNQNLQKMYARIDRLPVGFKGIIDGVQLHKVCASFVNAGLHGSFLSIAQVAALIALKGGAR